MRVTYKKPFAQFVKKSRKPLQLAIEDVAEVICSNPKIGRQKVGDLHGVFVHKFLFNKQEFLVAYQFAYGANQINLVWIDFYQIGSHENFYDQLKKFIRIT